MTAQNALGKAVNYLASNWSRLVRHVLERLPHARSVEDDEALLPWNCKPATAM